MRNVLLIIVGIISLMSCSNHSNGEFAALNKKKDSLEVDNKQLKEEVLKLQEEVVGYKTSPEKLLAEAKVNYRSEKLSELLKNKEQLVKYHPESKAAQEVTDMYAKAIAAYNKKIEDKERKEREAKEAAERKRMQAVTKLRKTYDDVSGITWYENPYFTHYDNINSTSICIGKSDSSVWLRLKMSYKGEDWIFFENAYLSYDGNTKQIYFNKYDDKESDNSSGSVWEWIDVSVDNSMLAFLKKMVNGKSLKMRLSGKYTKTKTLSSTEIKALKDVLLAYDVLVNGN